MELCLLSQPGIRVKAGMELDAKAAHVSPEDDAGGNSSSLSLLLKLCHLVWPPWSRHKAYDAVRHSSELAFLCLTNLYIQEDSGGKCF